MTEAPRIILREPAAYTLILVGCGGNGSYLAPLLTRIAVQLGQQQPTRLIFCDPDVVEADNLSRQSYNWDAVGRNKAAVLAQQCSDQYGIGIAYSPHPFSEALVPHPVSESLTVIVGCTDNGVINGQTGRQAIARCLQLNAPDGKAQAMPWVWWLDVGNHYQSGQVLLGSAPTWEFSDSPFIGTMAHTPSPALIHPELLDCPHHQGAGEAAGEHLNCQERAQVMQQSAGINPMMAALAHDRLNRLLITRDLTHWATYVDLKMGTLHSLTTAVVASMRDAQLNNQAQAQPAL